MINSLLIITLIAIMFWQPQMDSSYKPRPQYKPTKKEKYIRHISRLLDEGHYDIAASLLQKTKYPLAELPVKYWQEKVAAEIGRITKESSRLPEIKNLEAILGS